MGSVEQRRGDGMDPRVYCTHPFAVQDEPAEPTLVSPEQGKELSAMLLNEETELLEPV
jgi:hypothetical protein